MNYHGLLKLAANYEKIAEKSLERYLNNLKKHQLELAKRNKIEPEPETKSKLKMDSNKPAITRTLYKQENDFDPENELSEMEKAIYNI